MAGKSIKTYREFWPFYLSQHAHPLDRRLHFVGTTIVMAILATALATGRYWMLWLMPVAGYGFAWFGHFIVEKNRPATFTYPVWSLGSDFVMWWKMATFQIDAELRRYAILWPPTAEQLERSAAGVAPQPVTA